MPNSKDEFHRQQRSLFAKLRTLIRNTAEGRASVEDYVAYLEGRVGALARIQEMQMRSPAEGIDLQEIVCAELLSQVVREQRYRLRGPEIRIGREAAMPLALTLNELTINAIVHGALAHDGGCIEVDWNTVLEDGEEWLELRWRETGVEITDQAPRHRGFGLELIERMLPYELNARTAFELFTDGVGVTVRLPAFAGSVIWQRSSEE